MKYMTIKKQIKLTPLIFVLLMIIQASGHAQQHFFTNARESMFKNEAQKRLIIPSIFRAVSLDKTALLQFLQAVPAGGITDKKHNKVILQIPMPKGDTAKFYIWESSVMAPELAAKYPGIKSYTGHGITDSRATVKIDWTALGFHAMILSPFTGT